MANPEHFEILKQGAEIWNEWLHSKRVIAPLLANPPHHDGARFSVWNFSADLSRVDLSSLDVFNSKRGETVLDLDDADLSGAVLSGANLSFVLLRGATLKHAALRGASLAFTVLNGANLSGADMSNARMFSAQLRSANLRGADLSHAQLYEVIFSDVDLTGAQGLLTCIHQAPSTIDHRTLMRSEGLPLSFLRGCGLPDTLIEYLPSLLNNPVQFYSCFISYSSKDQEFAERLHADLQAKGVRVWFAPRDLPIGARIRPTIDESIRLHDKLLLVLSEASVTSQWVEQEVETALAREREQEGKTVLFPIRIDDAVMEVKSGWPALLKNTRNVGDFTRWKEHDSYREAFDRLLRDMRAEA